MQRDPLKKLLKVRDWQEGEWETNGSEPAPYGADMRKRLNLDGDIKLCYTDSHKKH